MRRWRIAIWIGAALTGGCSRTPAPPAQLPAVADAMPAESSAWTPEAAVEKLKEPDSAVPAAVRLVRLSEVQALCVPTELTAELAAHLQVVRLAEGRYALGFKQDSAGRRLVAPILLDETGLVVAPVPWERQEQAVLVKSDDPDQFPHVIVLPREVIMLRAEPVKAIVAKSIGKGRFDVVNERRGVSLAIMLEFPATTPDERPRRRVAARYRWDLAEQMFVGPGANDYPDPPGGSFEMDLESSMALLAVGGIIREPDLPEPESQPDEPSPF